MNPWAHNQWAISSSISCCWLQPSESHSSASFHPTLLCMCLIYSLSVCLWWAHTWVLKASPKWRGTTSTALPFTWWWWSCVVSHSYIHAGYSKSSCPSYVSKWFPGRLSPSPCWGSRWGSPTCSSSDLPSWSLWRQEEHSLSRSPQYHHSLPGIIDQLCSDQVPQHSWWIHSEFMDVQLA